MNRRALATFCFCWLASGVLATTEAGSLPDAKVALHLQPYTAKNICVPESQGGEAPDLTPCSQYATAGSTGTPYNAYLTVAAPSSLTEHPGVLALSCGILYQDGELGGATRFDGVGVDVYQWSLCNAGTEVPNGPTGLLEDEWPASGGGNRMVLFDCQLSTVPGYESEGVVAVFGTFYVYAYSQDVFEITPNNNLLSGPELQVVDCERGPTNLDDGAAGFLTFSADGSVPGCNPCLQDCDPDSLCSVPEVLDFGTVAFGDTRDLSFSVENPGSEDLPGTVASGCGSFTVIAGAGPYILAPGESHPVTVRYDAVSYGPQSCDLDVSGICPTVQLSAYTPGDCRIYPTLLNFGLVPLGSYRDDSFTITNPDTVLLEGTVTEACAPFDLVSGGGAFSLLPGQSHTVTVRFAPGSADLGYHECTISVSGACVDVPAWGTGYLAGQTGLDEAVVALHPAPHLVKGDPCAIPPAMGCSEYRTDWPLGVSADLWLVVARVDGPGVGAMSCGILYENGAVGGSTMANASGVDLYSWTLCTSGLQFPNSPTGLAEDAWPASGGGNRITWDSSVDCQLETIGLDGIHAMAGCFYVYAYSDDVFQVTPNMNLSQEPEFQLLDCFGSGRDLPYPERAGSCAFGSGSGYNPCADITPVRLLSFTAARVDAGAEVRWVVAGADEDHVGFEVYRGLLVDDRVRVSTGLLTGRESYTFVDDDPPSAVVSYWLAERSRTGETSWHGPVELAAALVPGPGLVLRHASPNPFLSDTRIAFRTGADGPVTVRVFDTAGREVARPFAGQLPAGDNEVTWDGRDDAGRRLSAGVYLYRIESAHGGGAGKVVLIR